MSNQFRSTVVTISNPQGLHMRPAYLFAETAAQFQSSVELVKDDIRADGKSVLSLMTLGASQGSEITLEANGEDAESAVVTLAELIASGFPTIAKPTDATNQA
jgi:phosphotransferase system HPr (HPr) family protein